MIRPECTSGCRLFESSECMVVRICPFHSPGSPSEGVLLIRLIIPQTPEDPEGDMSVRKRYEGGTFVIDIDGRQYV